MILEENLNVNSEYFIRTRGKRGEILEDWVLSQSAWHYTDRQHHSIVSLLYIKPTRRFTEGLCDMKSNDVVD